MADPVALRSTPVFGSLLAPIGEAAAGVSVRERRELGLALIQARENREGELAARISQAYGLAPPSGPRRAIGAIDLLGVGRGRWLAIRAADGVALADALAASLDGLAAVIDQTGGLGVLRISGPRARDVFAKGLPIDLDPSAFGPDAVAASLLAHIPVTIWRVDEANGFDVAVARSLAGDFARWLMHSAAEFGLSVEAD